MSAIDCDVHPRSPRRDDLMPYLDEYWREIFVSRTIDRLELTSYPESLAPYRHEAGAAANEDAAALAKTQRAAFLGGMCYLLSVSMVLLICATNNIPVLSNLAVEYHGPRILHAAMSQTVDHTHWLHLIAALVLACLWMVAAGWVFRRRGWQ